MATVATSPNEFSLVRMNESSGNRELVVGSANSLSTQSGTETKANVPFKLTRLRVGVYRVVPNAPLTPGQYAFVPPPSIAYGGNAGAAGASSLYDFTVR